MKLCHSRLLWLIYCLETSWANNRRPTCCEYQQENFRFKKSNICEALSFSSFIDYMLFYGLHILSRNNLGQQLLQMSNLYMSDQHDNKCLPCYDRPLWISNVVQHILTNVVTLHHFLEKMYVGQAFRSPHFTESHFAE